MASFLAPWAKIRFWGLPAQLAGDNKEPPHFRVPRRCSSDQCRVRAVLVTSMWLSRLGREGAAGNRLHSHFSFVTRLIWSLLPLGLFSFHSSGVLYLLSPVSACTLSNGNVFTSLSQGRSVVVQYLCITANLRPSHCCSSLLHLRPLLLPVDSAAAVNFGLDFGVLIAEPTLGPVSAG